MNLLETRKHLSGLERKGKLDKLLTARVDRLPWADIVHVLQVPAMIAIAIHGTRMALAYTERKEKPTDGDVLWLLLLILVALFCRFGWWMFRTRTERLRRTVRRRGLLVPAAIVQANEHFFDDDNDQWVPGELVVSFDPAVVQRPDALEAVAERVRELGVQDRRSMPEAHADIAWSHYHGMGPVRTRPVPDELGEGLRGCFVVSAMLPPKPMRFGDLVMVLALPDRTSPDAVAVVPDLAAVANA